MGITWRRTDPLAFGVRCETMKRVGEKKTVSMEREDLQLQGDMHFGTVEDDVARGADVTFVGRNLGLAIAESSV